MVVSIIIFTIPLAVFIFSIVRMVILSKRIKSEPLSAPTLIRSRVKYIVFTAITGTILLLYILFLILGMMIVASM